MTDTAEGVRQVNPWLAIWFRPQAAIREVVRRKGQGATFALAGVAMAADLLGVGSQTVHWFAQLTFALALALPLGMAGLYVGGALVSWVGWLLAGKASQRHVRAALAWSGAPSLIALLILIGAALALREDFVALTQLTPRASFTLIGIIAALILLALWSWVLMLRTLGAVEGFGIWRSIALATLSTVILLVASFGFRDIVLEPFSIPSASMEPTLLVGDVLFARKLAYGLGRYSFVFDAGFAGRIWGAEPRRGDLVIFRGVADPDTSYVKRVVGLPGEEIAMSGGVLLINGVAVPRELQETNMIKTDSGSFIVISRYRETLPAGPSYSVFDSEPAGLLDTVPPIRVPAGWYYVLGDNRDNSVDSRTASFGMVPADNLIGRVGMIYFSASEITGQEPISQAFDNIRWTRLLTWPAASAAGPAGD